MGNFQFVTSTMKLILLYYSISNLLTLALADPPYSSCSNSTLKNISFQNNLNTLLSSLPSNANVSKVYNESIRSDPDSAYVQFMCLNFMRSDSCSSCVRTAAQDVKNLCPQDREATVWEEDCQLRYSNRDFLGHLDVSGNQPYANRMNVSGDQGVFMSVVNETLSNLTARAAFDSSSSLYATGEASLGNGDTLYALVQCTTDLSPDDCQICLEVGFANVSSWFYNSRGARLLSHSCYLRYELYPFYDQDIAEAPSSAQVSAPRKRSVWKITVISASSAVLVIALSGSAFYCLVRNRKRRHQIADQEVQLRSIGERNSSVFQQQSFQGMDSLDTPESGFIDLHSILAATNDFSDSNLLGHGGFGPVYKGVLWDGKEVAVKRLASFSEQGDEEFTNEVLLIMKLQHKNLVKLLGYCIDGREKLLVYEFMPNSSLDAVLFDSKKSEMLDWSKRINIVDGIAKGLLYLHEDSRLKIIHRDLKASNVLLDNEMNPVISDFGTARIFAGNETNANTAKIVGTYGYMAPEYAMEGVYSIKSDVFSFGVLLLETITGIRNMGFQKSNSSPSLVSIAWRSWKEGNLMELADPSLRDSCSFEELARHVHVGLLCVQEDAEDRPNMSSVVSMLNSETTDLPQPEVPAFSLVRFSGNQESDDNNWSVNRLTVGSDLDG